VQRESDQKRERKNARDGHILRGRGKEEDSTETRKHNERNIF